MHFNQPVVAGGRVFLVSHDAHVYAFGLGPLPGVLAIAVHSTGALGKLFAEANENIDLSPVDGVRAAGAIDCSSSVMP